MTGAGPTPSAVAPAPSSFAPTARVLVVVPAYNEQDSVGRVVAEVRRAVPYADVLVVDDASRDLTRSRAQEAGAEVATLPINLGVGGAMRTGFRYALRHGYDVVVQVDGDGQHDARDLPQLLAALSGADVAIGARFAGTGDYRVRGPRAWAMRMLAFVLSRVCRTRLTDTTSGYRASGPRAVRLFAAHYPVEYLGDTVESLIMAARSGLVVTQVPVTMRPRTTGVASQSPFRATLYLLRSLMALVLGSLRRWPTHPPDEPENVT